MKGFSWMFFLALPTLAFAHEKAPLHFDLEMESAEYREHLKKNLKTDSKDDPAITRALALGERLSKWINLVNQNRSADSAIRLTSASTRRGIPIDKPNKYSPGIIKDDTATILDEMPLEMREIILSSKDFPVNLPVDDETFIIHARKLDRNYQSAARYKSIDVYRIFYVGAAKKDVRGHHYLVSNKITQAELKDVRAIPSEQVGPLKAALAQICLNSGASNCPSKVDSAFKENKLSAFYTKYFPAAQKVWDDFFKIPSKGVRNDVTWEKNVMKVPFNTPQIPKFIPYLQDNIEAEFRFSDWNLKIRFGQFGKGPRLIFKPGVVPHVNELGGNEIVMDSNQPIEEYESQWTIRHEFGHVIGLPDCYHEFYDSTQETYINYQLDITDLMCSRAGNMNERIYLELKKAYQ